MSGIVNKVKNALHSDNTTTTGTTGHSTTTGTHAGSHTTGTTHNPTVHSAGVPEGTAGHHTSRVANAADPRIDSDLDHGRGATGTHGLPGQGTTSHGTSGLTGTTHNTHGTSGLTGTGHNTTHTGVGHSTQPHNAGLTGAQHTGAGGLTGSTAHNTTGAGPHNSALLNKADPRVDSDVSHATHGRDHTIGSDPHTHAGLAGGAHSNTHSSGLTGSSHTGAHTGTGGLTGTSHNTAGGGLTGTGHNTHSTTTGGSGLTGHNAHNPNTTGITGAGHSTNTTAGPHHSDALNKADPRIDSDLSKTGGHAHTGPGHAQGTHNNGLTGNNNHTAGNAHSSALGSHATPGSGNAPNTAGPHNSDLLNKLDPRVDSNLDGSKTIGGNKTHTDTTSYAHKDVHDASQVPPSVFAAHKGEPEILHGDHTHNRSGRHGSLSHQEKHSGI